MIPAPRRALILVLVVCAAVLLALAPRVEAAPRVNLATISGSINPASADYLIEAIARSESDGAAALLVELDTPGGLVSSTKDIIQAILNSKVPVIVYVSPRGAWAASAGTFITVSAHVAAMAPSTSIGAAHPVSVGGGNEEGSKPGSEPGSEQGGDARSFSMEKAENLLAAYMETIAKTRKRNVEWVVDAVRNSKAIGEEEAVELGVVDLVADNRSQLLEAIEGREVDVAGEQRTLELTGSVVLPIEMTPLQALFNFLADPNVAMILFMAGLLGIYVEVNNPGLIVPGVAGAICLLLTGIAFQILPFSWVGLILVIAGIGLLVAEVFIASYGALFASGVLCFLLGGNMLFDMPEVSDLNVSFWTVLVPAVVAMAVFGGIVIVSLGRSMLAAGTAGVDDIVGQVGTATTALDPEGKVYVRGEYWNVEAEEPVGEGESVEVVAVDGLHLRVRRTDRRY
jgi:membrane-bound serine protease (ClpP class)